MFCFNCVVAENSHTHPKGVIANSKGEGVSKAKMCKGKHGLKTRISKGIGGIGYGYVQEQHIIDWFTFKNWCKIPRVVNCSTLKMALTLTNVQEAFQVGSHVPMSHVLSITDFT